METRLLKIAIPFACAIFLLASCAGVDRAAVVRDLKAGRSAGYFIEGVPFFPQDDYMCGPASLAGVIGYWGGDKGMAEVARKVYNQKLKGTFPFDLLIYAREAGFNAEYYEGGIGDLKEKLSSGTPLILFLNLGYDVMPKGHYIVAVGYDEKRGAVVAHSGMEKEAVYTVSELERSWSRTGHATIMVTPMERK